MIIIMMFCLTIALLVLLMTMLTSNLMMKKKKKTNKMKPFECGFNTISKKRLPFSIHFFMIGMMFIIFDIEIILITPMILSMKFSMTKYWMISTNLTIIILMMGLYHEWKNGMIKWTK